MVERFGQKKSEAEMPMKEKRKMRMRRMARAMNGLRATGAVTYHSA